MASGKSLELKAFDDYYRRPLAPHKPKARDRSLNGKARRKARKEANKG